MLKNSNRPDKVELTLPMISLLPDDAVIKLKGTILMERLRACHKMS